MRIRQNRPNFQEIRAIFCSVPDLWLYKNKKYKKIKEIIYGLDWKQILLGIPVFNMFEMVYIFNYNGVLEKNCNILCIDTSETSEF